MGKHTASGLGGFMSGESLRFGTARARNGSGGHDAWRDELMKKSFSFAKGRPRTTGTKLPPLHSIHRAVVVSVQEYGAFLQLGKGDKYTDGMMHLSSMCEGRIERCEDYGIKEGSQIWVKVSEVREEEGKYSLDMRYVNQQDGSDLDRLQTKGRVPNNFWAGRPIDFVAKKVHQDKGFTHFDEARELEREQAERADGQRLEAERAEAERAQQQTLEESGKKRKRSRSISVDAEQAAERSLKAKKDLAKSQKKKDKAQKKMEKMRKQLEALRGEKTKSMKPEKTSKKKKKSKKSSSSSSSS